LLLREFVVLVRERAVLLRGFAAAALVLVPVPEALFVRDAAAFLAAPLERVEPELADFARVDAALRPVLFFRELAALALRPPLDFLALPPLELAEDLDVDPRLALLDPSSVVHLPVSTRCAASATASAISDPSLVALVITLVAAWVAVSAASSPASRIARRALGLALIAAAAAARPAASISLLIAALASLSTVSFLLPEEVLDEPLRSDLAIA
jgi:hypothetical protein